MSGLIPVENTLSENIPAQTTKGFGKVPKDFKPKRWAKTADTYQDYVPADPMPEPPTNPHYIPLHMRGPSSEFINKGRPFVDFLATKNAGRPNEHKALFRFQLDSSTGTVDQVNKYKRKGWPIIWYGNLITEFIPGVTHSEEMIDEQRMIKLECDQALKRTHEHKELLDSKAALERANAELKAKLSKLEKGK